ncbi:DUF1353 domain-containing protein [Lysobacter korlensis]|uniref:DUF1353 domain-containing protein n=1 Tax=Lysobacter korlensis TaxID=553636 RepID=A0ABV6RVI9_9GAMM
MPFVHEDGSEVTAVALLQRDARRFQLVAGFFYVDPGTGRRYEIPAHDTSRPPGPDNENSTDLASVPMFLWGLIPSYGLQTRAALLHDVLADRADDVDGEAGWRLRREADRLFRVALLESEVPLLRALIMWCAVSMGRYTYRPFGPMRALLGTLQLAVGVLSVYAALVLPFVLGHPIWLALLGVPAALAAVVPRDRDYFALWPYLGALVLPIVVVAWLLARVFWALNAVFWLLSGRVGAAPELALRRFGAKPL